jgi:hypothetical protein
VGAVGKWGMRAAAEQQLAAPAGTAVGATAVASPAASLDHGNGQGVASLVFGILSVIFCWLGLLGAALVILSIVFGVIGILRARLGFSTGKGVAITGVVFGMAGLGLYVGYGVAGLGLGFRV